MFFDCVVESASTNESKNTTKSARMSANVEIRRLLCLETNIKSFLDGKERQIGLQFQKFSFACSTILAETGGLHISFGTMPVDTKIRNIHFNIPAKAFKNRIFISATAKAGHHIV